jgi:hypothetical protein
MVLAYRFGNGIMRRLPLKKKSMALVVVVVVAVVVDKKLLCVQQIVVSKACTESTYHTTHTLSLAINFDFSAYESFSVVHAKFIAEDVVFESERPQ